MNDYISSNAPSEIKNLYFKLNNIVAKADIWRYTILMIEGGIYLDIDSQITGSLNLLINSSDHGIITAEKNKNLFVQWALIFDKNHPILNLTLENIIKAVSEDKFKHDHHSLTVKTYADAIFQYSKNYGSEIKWKDITEKTDTTIGDRDSNVRLYGIDYNNFFNFKHKFNHLLRNRKKGQHSKEHWTEKQKTIPLY